ncbi:MAG: tetraacyldisaccharide 4'-kinase [Flavobacteriales bacterium]
MKIKPILYPVAAIYGLVVWLRNLCFDIGLFESKTLPGKSICIGNLAVGGTGKSPHTAYLINLLSDQRNIQVLSRGYGRNSTGYKEVNIDSRASEVGDEPLMLKQKYPDCTIAVCEDRYQGVQHLKASDPNSLIILDDAFQHRWVKAGLNIVLNTFDRPLEKDAFLPAGRLRDELKQLKRADALVITKCPSFDTFDLDLIRSNYDKFQIPVFFSRYKYVPLKALTVSKAADFHRAIIVSAIAHPELLGQGFSAHHEILYKSYKDHHRYSLTDIKEIHQFFDTFADGKTVLVTTAKDWVKINTLLSPQDQQSYPWMLLDFEIEWSDKQAFNQFIKTYVDAN